MNSPILLLVACLALQVVEANFKDGEGSLYNEDDSSGAAPRNGTALSIQFCCPKHFVYDWSTGECLPSKKDLKGPTIYTEDIAEVDPDNENYLSVTKNVECSYGRLTEAQFMILTTGEMLVPFLGSEKLDPDEALVIRNDLFCLLWMQRNETISLIAHVCLPKSGLFSIVQRYLLHICIGISAAFLAATFVVYCLVVELRDLLGRSLMASIAFLFCSKVLIVLGAIFMNRMTMTECLVFSMLIHFCFLVSFFWLNVISIIVCLSFTYKRKYNSKWFGVCCLYAFGVPLIIMALVLVHDLTSTLDHIRVPKPDIGSNGCGISNDIAYFVYYLIPILILLAVNFVLFCVVACKLCILAKQANTCTFQFKHYFKLMILMGVPWIIEILPLFFGIGGAHSVFLFIWQAFGIFNALQGVFIFVVIACRRTVFARLAKRLCGEEYSRKKYPSHYLRHADEDASNDDALTQDLRMTVVDKRTQE